MNENASASLCDATRQIAKNVQAGVPPMPDGFTDRAAWDAIHWRFSENGSVLDEAIIGWQRDNQERVKAAIQAASGGFRPSNECLKREQTGD